MIIEGKHYQNAYITRNIEKAITTFKKHADIRKILQYEGTTEVMTPAGRGTQTNKLAFIWVEDLQYEFIEPGPGIVEIYREALPADDSLKFHHICMRVPDWKKARAEVDEKQWPVAYEGGVEGCNFVYIDSRDSLGHYVEYMWMSEELWAYTGGK